MRPSQLLITCAIGPLAGCAIDPPAPAVPAVYFKMFYGASYDEGPFDAAWTAARQDPTSGFAYTFPLITSGIEPGSQIRLIAGRSTNDPSGPSTTADDVVIADERWLATSTVVADGSVEFPPLAIATGTWTSESNALPADLLCGTTVIAVRAFEPGHATVPAYRFLASTFMLAATPACP